MAAFPESGPVLAIDWGTRRIGVAISDDARTIALPLATLIRRTGRRFPLSQLRPILDERQPVAIVVGLPVKPDGSEGPHCREARNVGALLAEKTGLPVSYVDERLSTARVLASHRETGDRARSDLVDQEAAAVILQQFLDRLR